MIRAFLIGISASCLLGSAVAGDRVLIEGSSTVGPFARAALALVPGDPHVDVRQDGTGAGISHLCSQDSDGPAIAMASREIKSSELDRCAGAGVLTLVEKTIGRDGIVLAQSSRAKPMELTARDVFMAVGHSVPRGNDNCVLVTNTRSNWKEVRKDLPDREIRFIGPPRTSGTRDVFIEKAVKDGARTFGCLAELEERAPEYFERATRLRQDTHWIEGGEHDDAIAMTLEYVHDAIGIFGYAYLLNTPRIEPIAFNGALPEKKTISNGSYALSRPLFLYARPETLKSNKVADQIFRIFGSFAATGPQGILTQKGLVIGEQEIEPVIIDTATGRRRPFATEAGASGQ